MIELTLKFKEPNIDGLPDRNCKCLIFTDTGHFHEILFSAKNKSFAPYKIEEVCYYAELSNANNNTLYEMRRVADRTWDKNENNGKYKGYITL